MVQQHLDKRGQVELKHSKIFALSSKQQQHKFILEFNKLRIHVVISKVTIKKIKSITNKYIDVENIELINDYFNAEENKRREKATWDRWVKQKINS